MRVTQILKNLGCLVALCTLASCSGESGLPGLGGRTSIPSVEPIPTPVPTPVPTTSVTAMELDIKFAEQVIQTTHREGDWMKACYADPSSTLASGNKDVLCTMEIGEYDLYHENFTLSLDVPAGVCDYVKFYPYWFYSHEAGHVFEDDLLYDISASGSLSNFRRQDGSALPVGYDDFLIVDNKLTCKYDNSWRDGKNCCTGRIEAWADKYEEDGSVNRIFPLILFNGQHGNCAAGPAVTNFSDAKHKITNLPLPISTLVTGAAKIDYAITAPVMDSRATNLYSANYLAGAPPNALSAPPSVTATQSNTPRRYYEWHCLDHAEEIKAKIKLQIREWDDQSKFNAVRSTLGILDPLDLTPWDRPVGNETDFPESPWNDRMDWKDFIDWNTANANAYRGFPRDWN